MYYRLNADGTTSPTDRDAGCLAMEFGRSIIKSTYDDILVSTVFLVIDHGYFSQQPLLFETMVFGGTNYGDQRRYSTIQEARLGHAEMCGRHFNTAPWVD